MEKQVEIIIELMKKVEKQLKSASTPAYLAPLQFATGGLGNTKENVLELIQDSFEKLLPLLYEFKDSHTEIDLEKIVIEIWDLKEHIKNLFDKSETTVLIKAEEFKNQMTNLISSFKEKIA